MPTHHAASSDSPSLPLIGRARLPVAKLDVRKADEDTEARRVIGKAIEHTRMFSRLSLKEFSDLLERDSRQVARWISGEERPHMDAIFSKPELRNWLLVALSALAEGVVVETTISIRRTA